MKQEFLADLLNALNRLGIAASQEELKKIQIEYPDPQLGDYSANAALILAKSAKTSPKDLAEKIAGALDGSRFSEIKVAGPGFINFRLKNELLAETLGLSPKPPVLDWPEPVLVEYFQPNIAKPLHIGHLRTAIIGDAVKRMLLYCGAKAESDTHMGDWGTQFGLLILAYRKYGDEQEVAKDPITKLNEYYIRINQDAEADPSVREAGKREFVKLEQGDEDNRKLWKQFVDWSMERFLAINDLMDILPFDHHWPESFFEDKMPAVVQELKDKGLLAESQGAQIVDLEKQGLGIAVIVKSDGGTTYLLRDLATFRVRKQQGYRRQLYVVDNRQSHHYRQLFAILRLMGEMQNGEAEHIDYGFMSFKGQALSTRKGNMVLAQEVIAQAEEKVAAIIEQKNPDLAGKPEVIKAVSRGALKYYDLSHNRRSDIEFDWEEALDFDGNSGPYLQYTYARLASILRKMQANDGLAKPPAAEMTPTERQLVLETGKFSDAVAESLKDCLPNVLANYLYSLANLANRFYHESPVAAETDEKKKLLRLAIVKKTKAVLRQGLDLLGIKALEEM